MREEEEKAMLTYTTKDRDREGDQIGPLKFPLWTDFLQLLISTIS